MFAAYVSPFVFLSLSARVRLVTLWLYLSPFSVSSNAVPFSLRLFSFSFFFYSRMSTNRRSPNDGRRPPTTSKTTREIVRRESDDKSPPARRTTLPATKLAGHFANFDGDDKNRTDSRGAMTVKRANTTSLYSHFQPCGI